MREAMLVVHFLGLAMGLGTSFGFMFLGMATAKMEKEEAAKFMATALKMGRMGHIGLVLLLLSGGYLMTASGINRWSTLLDSGNHLLLTKLILFIVLGGLIGVISSKSKKVGKGDYEQLNSIKKLGPLAMLTGIAIVVLAVLYFR